MWLSGLRAGLRTRRSLVQFPVRAHKASRLLSCLLLHLALPGQSCPLRITDRAPLRTHSPGFCFPTSAFYLLLLFKNVFTGQRTLVSTLFSDNFDDTCRGPPTSVVFSEAALSVVPERVIFLFSGCFEFLLCLLFIYLFIYLEKGEEREKERERNISSLPLF